MLVYQRVWAIENKTCFDHGTYWMIAKLSSTKNSDQPSGAAQAVTFAEITSTPFIFQILSAAQLGIVVYYIY